MSKCTGCGRFVSAAEAIKCTACDSVYERFCLKLSKSASVPPDWLCPGCTCKQPKNGNVDTPIQEKKVDPPPKIQITPNSHAGNAGTARLEKEIKLFRSELSAMRSEVASIGSKFDKLLSAVGEVNKRIDGIEGRVTALEERSFQGAAAPSENHELANTIERLKLDLNERDQELLLTDVEITGLPEVSGENSLHLLTLVAEKLGVQIEERDVVSVERGGGVRRGGAVQGSAEGADVRPRPLVVRLARRTLRDQLLRAARVRRGTDTSGMQLPGVPRKFYVNERLTRHNRQLFYKARQAAAQHRWKYVWTRNGRIFARRTTDSEARRLRTDADLAVVFGDGSIGH